MGHLLFQSPKDLGLKTSALEKTDGANWPLLPLSPDRLGYPGGYFFTKLYQRLFRPGLAAFLPPPPYPSDLAQALNQVSEVIQFWAEPSSVALSNPSKNLALFVRNLGLQGF